MMDVRIFSRSLVAAMMCIVVLMNANMVSSSTRQDRVWPLSATDTVDLGQSSPFGPRLLASANLRYDFHRGVDIPTPEGTPVYAIDGGKVRIAGSHPAYTDKLVQLVHTNWEEAVGTKFYSNYMHLLNVSVSKDQIVSKGQLVGFSSHPASGFNHLHFEIRVGGLYQRHCCNPWKYLPNAANSYSMFNASLTLLPNPGSANCKANVTVTVPPDQLMFNRVELHVDADGQESVYTYDMCEDNLSHTFSEMDDPNFEDFLIISPTRFSSSSYGNGESAGYLFQFYDLPSGNIVQVKVKIFDVFNNSRESSQMTLSCL